MQDLNLMNHLAELLKKYVAGRQVALEVIPIGLHGKIHHIHCILKVKRL